MTSDLALRWRIALGIGVFIGLELVLINFVDRPLSVYLRSVDARHQFVIDFFRLWTDLGKSIWYLVPSGIGVIILFILCRLPRFSAEKRRNFLRSAQIFSFFFVCVAVSGLITNITKRLLGRGRPVLLDREEYYGFDPLIFQSAHHSMPSGHTTTAFAVAFALMAIWPNGRPLLLVFALALTASRIMVNAHYLSDTVAGAAVGILTVLFFQRLFYARGWMVRPDPAATNG